ncbi:hypothetical protein RUND412_001451 [Rhizina undulata]
MDGTMLQLECTDCEKGNFINFQAIMNHCRIQHKRKYKDIEEMILYCGKPVGDSAFALVDNMDIDLVEPKEQELGISNDDLTHSVPPKKTILTSAVEKRNYPPLTHKKSDGTPVLFDCPSCGKGNFSNKTALFYHCRMIHKWSIATVANMVKICGKHVPEFESTLVETMDIKSTTHKVKKTKISSLYFPNHNFAYHEATAGLDACSFVSDEMEADALAGPVLKYRKVDGTVVSLRCNHYTRDDFYTAQMLLVHIQYAHYKKFKSVEEMAFENGKQVDGPKSP